MTHVKQLLIVLQVDNSQGLSMWIEHENSQNPKACDVNDFCLV
jgi:hypothetical protein